MWPYARCLECLRQSKRKLIYMEFSEVYEDLSGSVYYRLDPEFIFVLFSAVERSEHLQGAWMPWT